MVHKDVFALEIKNTTKPKLVMLNIYIMCKYRNKD